MSKSKVAVLKVKPETILTDIERLCELAGMSAALELFGISKYIAPRALFWFRWGAVATWLTGAWYLIRSGNFGGALTLGMGNDPVNYYQLVIGIGAWLGTIMLFNVWVLIWPTQQKILGIKPATDDEKAKARKVAGLASRTNFVLSIPMLLCMASATHGLPF